MKRCAENLKTSTNPDHAVYKKIFLVSSRKQLAVYRWVVFGNQAKSRQSGSNIVHVILNDEAVVKKAMDTGTDFDERPYVKNLYAGVRMFKSVDTRAQELQKLKEDYAARVLGAPSQGGKAAKAINIVREVMPIIDKLDAPANLLD